MQDFKIHGLNARGEVHSECIRARTQQDAITQFSRSGLSVIAVDPSTSISLALKIPSHRAKFNLSLFSQELLVLLRAGLSLIDIIETLAEREKASDGTIKSVAQHLREGESFSQALRRHPEAFSSLFIASIQASEHTGEMALALDRYLRYDRQFSALKQKLFAAALYPVLLSVVGLSVAAFMVLYLVPRFSGVYEGMQEKLPVASRWLMEFGLWANQNLGLLGALVATGLISLAVLLARPATRSLMLAKVLGQGWVSRKVRLVRLSRFYRALGLLLSGGIPILEAFDNSKGLLAANLQYAAQDAINAITRGIPLSDALLRSGLATEVSLRLVRAGERNGELANMLEQSSIFHDEEIAQWIDRASRLFEPLLMLTIGLVIGLLVILLYLPIFELASNME